MPKAQVFQSVLHRSAIFDGSRVTVWAKGTFNDACMCGCMRLGRDQVKTLHSKRGARSEQFHKRSDKRGGRAQCSCILCRLAVGRRGQGE